jgi:WD40 repeat protein
MGHTGGLVSLAYSPDGTRIASGAVDLTVRIWDARPLPAEVLREHDDRYRRKLSTLKQAGVAKGDDRTAAADASSAR